MGKGKNKDIEKENKKTKEKNDKTIERISHRIEIHKKQLDLKGIDINDKRSRPKFSNMKQRFSKDCVIVSLNNILPIVFTAENLNMMGDRYFKGLAIHYNNRKLEEGEELGLVTQEYENCYIPISNDAEAFSKGSNWSVDILQYLEGCTSNPQLTKRNLESLLKKDYKDFKSVENIEDRTQIVIDNIRKCVGNKDKPMKLFLVELYTECKVKRDKNGGIGQLHCISIDCRGDDEKDWLIIDGMVYRDDPLPFSLDNLIEVQKYSEIKGERRSKKCGPIHMEYIQYVRSARSLVN